MKICELIDIVEFLLTKWKHNNMYHWETDNGYLFHVYEIKYLAIINMRDTDIM